MDGERRWFFHSCIGITWPIVVDLSQIRLTLGITCPRHRYLLKQRLGWFGRWLPDREWGKDENDSPILVSVGGWKEWRSKRPI